MKNFRIIYTTLLVIGLLSNGAFELNAQFMQNSSRSLFSDVKAFKTGDAILVLITEDTQAGNEASTADSRSTTLGGSFSGGVGANSVKADGSIGTTNDFKGTGSTQRKESIRSKLSARVVAFDSTSGNLVIEGKRTTKINGETQTIVIKGIVRPVDVMSNNSVYSYSILDLTLLIEGDGTVSKVQEPGLITKFLRMLF